MGMVKNGCVPLGHGALWPVVSQEWMNELSWFFACSYMVSGKLDKLVTLGMHNQSISQIYFSPINCLHQLSIEY